MCPQNVTGKNVVVHKALNSELHVCENWTHGWLITFSYTVTRLKDSWWPHQVRLVSSVVVIS